MHCSPLHATVTRTNWLTIADVRAVQGKMGKHKSRMKKKEQKAHKELDRQLKDAQMDVDLKALARRQLVILNQVGDVLC